MRDAIDTLQVFDFALTVCFSWCCHFG